MPPRPTIPTSAFLPILLLPSVLGAFTHSDRVCWRRDCVAQTDTGTLCFEPHGNSLEQECADDFLKNLTHVHLTSTDGGSILYYDNRTHVLGAATWIILPAIADSVYVCMTGRGTDHSNQSYRTVCRKTYGDDDMEVAAAHTHECFSDEKPRHASDGCFSLGKPAGGDGEHKEWYEQPVVAGFFWLLSALLTLGVMYMWGGAAVLAVRARLPRRSVVYAAIVEQLARRGWRRRVPSPLVQQPPTILDRRESNGTTTRSETMIMLNDRATAISPTTRPLGSTTE